MLLIFIHCVRTGCRTFYQKEVKIDEALVTTPSQPSFPFTHRQELKKGINQSNVFLTIAIVCTLLTVSILPVTLADDTKHIKSFANTSCCNFFISEFLNLLKFHLKLVNPTELIKSALHWINAVKFGTIKHRSYDY